MIPAALQLGPRRAGSCRMAAASLLAAFALSACFTEVGNPGSDPQPTQGVTAEFRIDYGTAPDGAAPAPKRAAPTDTGKSLRIDRLYFNIVEANYRTLDDVEGRFWKVPDSLGYPVDFTGADTAAVLPPVMVPPDEWKELKLESRVPRHDTVAVDTLDPAAFAHRGYIAGFLPDSLGGARFYCQFPNYPKVNLVYNDSVIGQWRVNDAYHIEVVFYADQWLGRGDLDSLAVEKDRNGSDVILIDQQHNIAAWESLAASFFKSFNSYKVWKEGDPTP